MRIYARKRERERNIWQILPENATIVDRTFTQALAEIIVSKLKEQFSGGYFRITKLVDCGSLYNRSITVSFKDPADEAFFIIKSSDGFEI